MTTWAMGYCKFPQVPFRRIFEPLSRPVPPEAEIVTAYTNGQVTLRSNRRLDGYHEAANLSSFQGVRAGDFVVHGLDILRGSVGVSDSDGAISAVCTVCTPRRDMDPRFFAYAMRAQAYSGFPRAMARGIREGGADFRRWDTLGDLPLPLPPDTQLGIIADYLDAETAGIDDLLAAIRQSLRLIAEHRRSLITEVFLQPVHSERGSTVRALADALLGRQRSPAQAEGPYMVRYLRAANVKDGRLDLTDVMEMNFNPREQRTFALTAGDVLITEGAGSVAAVGANAIWKGELPGVICFQNTLVRLRPKEDSDPRFVGWWARYAFESGLLGSVAGGANIFHLGVETVRSLPAWAPRRSVQKQVADRLDREVASLQQQVAARRRQIDLLTERRQALITAAVTGQLEIPGVGA